MVTYGETGSTPVELTDDQLVAQINEGLHQLDATSPLRTNLESTLNELVRRWHAPPELPPPPAVPAGNALQNSKVKLSPPAAFDGNSKTLSNFLFQVKMYASVCGIINGCELVKLAVTLLSGRALTWWRSVAEEEWAILGLCDWNVFCSKIEAQFRDLHHVLRQRRELAQLRQTTSVQAYNSQFRTLAMELRTSMTDNDLMFCYLNGLKDMVQAQVMLMNPATLEQAMLTADRADATFWFSSGNAGGRPPKQAPRPPQPQAGLPRRPNNNGVVPMELGVQKGSQNAGQSSGQRETRACYYCGRKGHIAKNCWQKQRANGQQGVLSSVYQHSQGIANGHDQYVASAQGFSSDGGWYSGSQLPRAPPVAPQYSMSKND